eukprot:179506_1
MNKNNNIINRMLESIYGSIEFTINIDEFNEGIPFLDCTLYIDALNNKIRTKYYSKPGNIHEYCKEFSNIPHHTLKSIIIGICKRLIIINDNHREYEISRNKLYQRLIQLGWNWDSIDCIRDKPSYS